MLLTAEENGFGGKCATPPLEWFEGKTDDYLNMHLIPKDKSLWELDNFEEFTALRKKLILEKFSHMIQSED